MVNNVNCDKCGFKLHPVTYNEDTYTCDKCDDFESHCGDCGSSDLEYYDDGEGYPPNILCKKCGNWLQ